MKRHPAKRYPKLVRLAVARLVQAGAEHVRVEVGRAYMLTWTAGTQRMRVAAGMAARGNAFETLWATIRALFRTRGLEVPA